MSPEVQCRGSMCTGKCGFRVGCLTSTLAAACVWQAEVCASTHVPAGRCCPVTGRPSGPTCPFGFQKFRCNTNVNAHLPPSPSGLPEGERCPTLIGTDEPFLFLTCIEMVLAPRTYLRGLCPISADLPTGSLTQRERDHH